MDEHESDVLLCRAQYTVQKSEMTLCLYACRAGIAFEYALELGQDAEHVRCEIGRDRTLAQGLFCRILSAGVSICHFEDVIGDELFATM